MHSAFTVEKSSRDVTSFFGFMKTNYNINAKKRKILFVCKYNMMRSKTAQNIYENDIRFEVRSAGIHKRAEQTIDIESLNWADSIVVMEKQHQDAILKQFPAMRIQKKLTCLNIPDEYDYMQSELVANIRRRFENSL